MTREEFWLALKDLARKHGEPENHISDKDGWLEEFDNGSKRTPEETFYDEFPEHIPPFDDYNQ